MEKRGFPKEFAGGITVASSTMGMIIPPSIPMVIYAVTAQESVGRLFLGGLLPGVLVGVFQLALVFGVSRRRGYAKEEKRFTAREIMSESVRALYVLAMPLFVVGTVVFGVATATESAALGVLYAALVGFVFTRGLTLAAFLLCAPVVDSDECEGHDDHRDVSGVHLGARPRARAADGGAERRRARPSADRDASSHRRDHPRGPEPSSTSVRRSSF